MDPLQDCFTGAFTQLRVENLLFSIGAQKRGGLPFGVLVGDASSFPGACGVPGPWSHKGKDISIMTTSLQAP